MCNLSLPTKGQEFKYTAACTCESSNLIYVITCWMWVALYWSNRIPADIEWPSPTKKCHYTAVSGHLRNCPKNIFRTLQCILSIRFIKQQPKKNVKNISFQYLKQNWVRYSYECLIVFYVFPIQYRIFEYMLCFPVLL